MFSSKPIPSGNGPGRLLLLLVLFALVGGAPSWGAPPPAVEPHFYEKAREGWFWYHDPTLEEEEPPPPPPAVGPEVFALPAAVPPPGTAAPFIPEMADYSLPQLWKMHPDQFQPLLNAFLKKAVQVPNPENVRDYMTMQDVARRKAAEYANVAGYVLQTTPELNLNRDSPIVTPGVVAKGRLQREEIATTIKGATADHALLYFSQEGCPYCAEQRAILRYFTDRYGWPLKEIAIDQEPLMAARFGIKTTPTLLLIQKQRPEYLPVAVGVVSLDEIEQTLYRSIRLLNGEITPQEYSLYNFQKGGGLDPQSVLQNPPPTAKDQKRYEVR